MPIPRTFDALKAYAHFREAFSDLPDVRLRTVDGDYGAFTIYATRPRVEGEPADWNDPLALVAEAPFDWNLSTTLFDVAAYAARFREYWLGLAHEPGRMIRGRWG